MTTVAIIGGGFTGTLTAVNLIRKTESPLKVVLVEPREIAGRGIAYSTTSEKHLLNVPAGRMSAFADEPLHFLKWAKNKGIKCSESSFLPRRLYGEYIQSILESTLTNLPTLITFERVTDEALSVTLIQDETKAVVKLAGGDNVVADKVVLALGNFSPSTPSGISQSIARSERYLDNPWKLDQSQLGTKGGDALLIGTGLTMIDKALELINAGFEGTIYAVSRHGLLPRAHSKSSWPAFAQTTLKNELYGDLGALFKAVKDAIRSGSFEHLFDNASSVKMEVSDWRQVIDTLRPHSQTLWAALSNKEKKRFLRHVRAYWDVHRHRMAPEMWAEIEKLIESGRIKTIAGRLYSVHETSEAAIATISPRGGGQPEQLKLGFILNCSGHSPDFTKARSSLAQSLLTRGLAQVHPSGMGISVRSDGAVLDSRNRPSKVLYTLGSITVGLRGESTAVPELRVQACNLASSLVSSHLATEISVLNFDEQSLVFHNE